MALLLGGLAGLASGALGIGGGLVVVPLLSAWLGMPLKRAVGTSLVAVLATALVAVLSETLVAPSNLRWSVGLVLSIMAVVGSWIGTRIVARIAPGRLAILMALMLLIAALRMSGLLALMIPTGSTLSPMSAEAQVATHAGVGLAAGLIAALFGIGGGILAVPALATIHPDWVFQACRATSLIMIVPTSLAATILHHRVGNVDGAVARALIPGCAAGAVLGVLLANHVPERPLEIAFAALLVVSSIRLLRTHLVSTQG